ncbi:MAG: RNA-binding transcriptional accessory protein, partial [Prevotella sp.]|nr:RNA-binding transcriptional accessory protein [Prevotella sp.]
MNTFTPIIAKALNLNERNVEKTLELLNQGCTIPFIARYRKESTGGLDEVQIGNISDWNDRLCEMSKRKETICKTIEELGKMTQELKTRIDNCWNATELEDIYLPYKPKRRTRAQVAREQGLEPLANILMLQRERDPQSAAKRFVNGDSVT